MVANGARKTPPSSSPKLGTIIDLSAYHGVFSEKDKKPISIKIKQPSLKQTKPGNWRESEVIDPTKKADSATSKSLSPIVNTVNDRLAAAFPTSRPLEDVLDTVQCKHCRRPVLRKDAASHIKECLNKKQEKQKKKKEAKEAKEAALRKERGEDKDDDAHGKTRKTAVKGSTEDGAKKGKKRKAEGDGDKPTAKKKKKDEPKPKVPKPKGPVDVEKQCGVPLANGAMCARSLTCKSHSMGAKRAVPGRSLPYDMLLAQYQKKNQAKQQRAAMDANAPLDDDLEASGPVNSDEETELIMAAIARSRPQPLVTRPLISIRKKYSYFRMKDMFHNALAGTRGTNLFATSIPASNAGSFGPAPLAEGAGFGTAGQFSGPLGSAGLDQAAAQGAMDGARRSSSVALGQGQRAMHGAVQLPPSRKASVAGAAPANGQM